MSGKMCRKSERNTTESRGREKGIGGREKGIGNRGKRGHGDAGKGSRDEGG
jgi:hypothetical protein